MMVPSDNTRRYVTLAGAILVALASGSNYVYSGYAPQLASRLRISSTQVNLIGMAGNLGVYGSGPVWGKVIDASGPKIPLICGFFLQFIGYFGIRLFYTGALSFPAEASGSGISTFGLCLMMLFMCFTGCGGCAGLNSGMNTVAKSFPDEMRATAAGMTLAGYGLSAFFFSNISRAFFPGNTNALLLLLAIGTSVPMLMGIFLIKVVRPVNDLPPAESGWGRVSGEGYQPLPTTMDDDDELTDEEDVIEGRRTILAANTSHNGLPSVHVQVPTPSTSAVFEDAVLNRSSVEISRTGSATGHRHPFPDRRESHELSVSPPRHSGLPADEMDGKAVLIGSTNRSPSAATHRSALAHEVDIHGKAMFVKVDFWLSFGILALLSGTGLMYINNVGSVVLALANEGSAPKYDPITIALYQGSQVSVVSLWNCLGRIAMGMMSDYAKSRFRIRRVWFCSFIALIFTISQIAAQYCHSLPHLWWVSTLVGFAYGNLFALMPIVVLEWFGLAHFSQNWGLCSLSPGLGGNLANLLFGRVYDQNSRDSSSASGLTGLTSRALDLFARGGGVPADGAHTCYAGQACYSAAFKATTVGCIAAFVLSLVAAIRRERQSRLKKKQARLEARWNQEGHE